MQDERPNAEAFINELGLGYTMLADPQLDAARAYGVRGLPTVVLVDAAGQIAYQGFELPPRAQIDAVIP